MMASFSAGVLVDALLISAFNALTPPSL